ncbi:hypothetical protein BKA69DRAFT_1125310 [Paraphysoderma sedebokerense]|nr:hypothetical protein BKA69DRAFT_1125310 [Paraphysoderma sedebokerense]
MQTASGSEQKVEKPSLQSSSWTNSMLRQELKNRKRHVDSIKVLPKRKEDMIAVLLKSYGDEVAQAEIVSQLERAKKRSKRMRRMNTTQVNDYGGSHMSWARELKENNTKCYELHPNCPPIKAPVNPLWLEPFKLDENDPTRLDFRALAKLRSRTDSESSHLDSCKKKVDIDFDLQRIPKVCSALEAVKQFTSDEMRRIVDKYKGQKDMWDRYFKRRYSDRKILHDEWKRLGSDDHKFLEVYGMMKDGTMVSMFMDQAFRKLLSLKTQLLEEEKRKDIYKRDGVFSQEEFSKMWRYGHINNLGIMVKPSAKRKVGDFMTDLSIRNALWRSQYGSNFEDDD